MSQKDTDKRNLTEEDEDGSRWQGGGDDTGGFGFLYEDPLKSSQHSEDEEGGEGRAGGGAAGEIEFRYKDPYFASPRDDQLPPEEIKRLLIAHKEYHKGNVDKQKNLRKDRAALKEGKFLDSHPKQQKGYGPGGGFNNFKTHPIALKAQFSGSNDKQVNNFPSNNEANTNDQLKNELQNRLENRLENRLNNKPSSAPRPRPI